MWDDYTQSDFVDNVTDFKNLRFTNNGMVFSIFVGPKGDSIRVMGDKVAARVAAEAAGVPVVPGSDGRVDDPEQAKHIAMAIGFPVMIKAAAGGGGRGIRKVESAAELEDAYQRFLVKGVHESFDLSGVPLFLDIVGKPKQTGRRAGGPGASAGASPIEEGEGRKPLAKVPGKAVLDAAPKKAVGPSGPRLGKSKNPRSKAGPVRKKSYTRWDKPRSLKGRAARQARK